MLRLIRAFIWYRLRVLVNTLKAGARRDVATRLSELAEVLVPIVLAVALIPATLALAAVAVYAGWWSGTQAGIPLEVLNLPRVMLGVATIIVLIMPLASALQGSISASERLLLLPISRPLLHLLHMFSGLGDPVLILLSPALLAFPLGFAIAGDSVTALLTLALGFCFLLVLLTLQSTAELLFQLLFRSRRRFEWFGILFILAISGLAFIPVFMESRTSEEEVERQLLRAVEWILTAAPSQLYYNGLRAHLEGRLAESLLNLFSLLVVVAVLFIISWRLYERLLESPGLSGPRKRERLGGWRHWKLPGLSAGAAAVAQAQFRNAVRSTRGRMALFMAPFMVPLLGFAIFFGRRSEFFEGDFPVDRGILLALMAVAFSLLTFQPILLNLFGSDLAGLSLQFLSPISDRELVLGKLTGGALLTWLATLLGLVAALVVDQTGSFWLWLALPVVAFSAYLVLGPAAVLLSAVFPRAADLSHWGKKGNPHPMAGFLGTLLIFPSLGFPLSLAGLSLWITGTLFWVWVVILLWAMFSLLAGLALVRLGSDLVGRRREALALAAQER